jgi:hypothetical protein
LSNDYGRRKNNTSLDVYCAPHGWHLQHGLGDVDNPLSNHVIQLLGYRGEREALHYPQLWQGIGMIVGVYGIGYALAARDPVRLWPLVLVGLLGKVFGPVGLVYGVITNQMSIAALITMIPNDLIWWVPFGLILRRAYWESKAIPR